MDRSEPELTKISATFKNQWIEILIKQLVCTQTSTELTCEIINEMNRKAQ